MSTLTDLRPVREGSPLGDRDLVIIGENLTALERLVWAEHRLGLSGSHRGIHKTRRVPFAIGAYRDDAAAGLWSLRAGEGVLPGQTLVRQGVGQATLPMGGLTSGASGYGAGLFDILALATGSSTTSPLAVSYADPGRSAVNLVTAAHDGTLTDALGFSLRLHATQWEPREHILAVLPQFQRGDALGSRTMQEWFIQTAILGSILDVEHDSSTGEHWTRKVCTSIGNFTYRGGPNKYKDFVGTQGNLPTESVAIGTVGKVEFVFTTAYASADDYDVYCLPETDEATKAIVTGLADKTTTGFTLVFRKINAGTGVNPSSFSIAIHEVPGSRTLWTQAERRDFRKVMRLPRQVANDALANQFKLEDALAAEHDVDTGEHNTRTVATTSGTWLLSAGPVWGSAPGSIIGTMPDAPSVVTTGRVRFGPFATKGAASAYDLLALAQADGSTVPVAVSYYGKSATQFDLIFETVEAVPTPINPESFSLFVHEGA